MKQNPSENPIEAAMQSLEGIQRASADETLFHAIEARIKAQQAKKDSQQRQIRRLTQQLAAAAVLMLVFNCVVWLSVGIPQLRAAKVEQFSRMYFISSSNY